LRKMCKFELLTILWWDRSWLIYNVYFDDDYDVNNKINNNNNDNNDFINGILID